MGHLLPLNRVASRGILCFQRTGLGHVSAPRVGGVGGATLIEQPRAGREVPRRIRVSSPEERTDAKEAEIGGTHENALARLL